MVKVKNTKVESITNYTIYIIGASRFSNEMLAHILEEKKSVNCRCLNDFREIFETGEDTGQSSSLVLFDCHGKTIDDFINEDLSEIEKTAKDRSVALTNVKPDLDIENNCMHHGVRGVFYDQDSLNIFMKGIEAICKGELWYSRRVMSRAIGKSREKDIFDSNTKKSLTHREIEILSLVAIGAKNDEIADKLFVSPHTIKTHLYNVYKKLSVSNRLQATLWAAKHL